MTRRADTALAQREADVMTFCRLVGVEAEEQLEERLRQLVALETICLHEAVQLRGQGFVRIIKALPNGGWT